MNTPKTVLLALITIALSQPFHASSQAANTQDSLALVDLFNSTNGPNWINNTNWLTTSPLSTWNGLVVPDGQVYFLALNSNHLVGTHRSPGQSHHPKDRHRNRRSQSIHARSRQPRPRHLYHHAQK